MKAYFDYDTLIKKTNDEIKKQKILKYDDEDIDDDYELTNINTKHNKLDDYTKYKNIKIDDLAKNKLSNKISSDINKIDKTDYARSLRNKDKSDRATVEQVLDSRTSMILYKLVNKGILTKFMGCISTGKEANVYYATGEQNKELADHAVAITGGNIYFNF
jgi:RIO kinase 1